MDAIIEIVKKDANIQNEKSQTIEKYNKESLSTRFHLGQNVLIQSKVFKKAKKIMGETISDLDIELEQKKNKLHFLKDKMGIPDSRVIDGMNGFDLCKISSEEKNDRIMNMLNRTINNHKYNKKENQIN